MCVALIHRKTHAAQVPLHVLLGALVLRLRPTRLALTQHLVVAFFSICACLGEGG